MIRFPCSKCDVALKVPDDRAGQTITCPKCQRRIDVPESLDDDPPAAGSDEGTGAAAGGTRGRPTVGWYYTVGGIRHGPVSYATLRALADDGTLKPSDLVWQRAMDEWTPASQVTGLFPKEPPPLPDDPPPLPRRTAPRKTRRPDEPIVTWEPWQIWVFSIVTLGLFNFYLIPSWAKQVEHITGKPRMPFGAVLTLEIFTLGIALMVIEIVYTFELARHGERSGRQGSHRQLGSWVLTLNLVAFVWSVVTSAVGFVLGGVILGVLATWLVQAEINQYAEEHAE